MPHKGRGVTPTRRGGTANKAIGKSVVRPTRRKLPSQAAAKARAAVKRRR